MSSWRVIEGDCYESLRRLPDQSVQTCITSPPYWGLRDYGHPGQLGLERTPDQYVRLLVTVFREVRRVLRDDGTLWLNLGDSYARNGGDGDCGPNAQVGNTQKRVQSRMMRVPATQEGSRTAAVAGPFGGLKPKDLVGIPWSVAFALRADGWYLRSEVIWAKPNPMPESVTDRPTRAHEQVFLLSKSARYFYDAEAVREDDAGPTGGRQRAALAGDDRYADGFKLAPDRGNGDRSLQTTAVTGSRNKRSVWNIATAPFPGAHFAVFPPKLVEPMVLAGSSPQACGICGAPWVRQVERGESSWEARKDAGHRSNRGGSSKVQLAHGASHGFDNSVGGFGTPASVETVGWQPSCGHQDDTGTSTVLDPFCGAGTTGVVALRHDRSFIGLELNPTYAEMARQRIRDDAPLFNNLSEQVA